MIVSKKSNYTAFRISKIENYIRDLDDDISSLFTALQRRIRFGDATDGKASENIAGEFQVYTSNGTADTEDAVAHTLGSIPKGFLVINIDKGGVVYDSGTAWTSSNIYLKVTTISTAVTLFLIK